MTRATATRGTAVPVSGRARANAPMSGRVPVAAWTLISALVLGACGCAGEQPDAAGLEPPTRSFAAHRVQLSRLTRSDRRSSCARGWRSYSVRTYLWAYA